MKDLTSKFYSDKKPQLESRRIFADKEVHIEMYL